MKNKNIKKHKRTLDFKLQPLYNHKSRQDNNLFLTTNTKVLEREKGTQFSLFRSSSVVEHSA
ncbi:hypothetical protein, partial [Peribacillus simplex]